MTTIINGSSPSITFSDGSAQTSATRPFLNRIINGAMVIDQRNAGTVTVNSSGLYTVDRWQANQTSAGKFSVGKSTTAPAGFTNSYLATSLSAYSVSSTDIFFFNQNIEGNNIADLGWGTADAQAVTLSFRVRSSLTGTFGGAVANSAHNRTYPFSYTINSANTWETKSITIAGDTSGTWLTDTGVGMQVIFGLGGGSTRSGTAGSWQAANLYTSTGATSLVGTNGATFYITGVQLEVGSTATSFDYRPYGTELQLCQRYYQQITGASGSGYYGIGTGTNTNPTIADILAPLPVTMRVIPTTSFSGTIYLFDASGNPAITSISNTYGGQSNIYMGITATGGGLTVGRGVYLYTNNATSSIFRFSAEL